MYLWHRHYLNHVMNSFSIHSLAESTTPAVVFIHNCMQVIYLFASISLNSYRIICTAIEKSAYKRPTFQCQDGTELELR